MENAPKLCLYYDEELEKHFTDQVYVSHNGVRLERYPECPERIRSIWRRMSEAGILEREDVLRLETDGRLVTREECCAVHSDQFWRSWTRCETMDDQELEQLASSLNSIYLNRDSVRCAMLAAGAVLTCVDHVLTGVSRSAWAVVRPPGHHADADTSAGFCIINNVGVGARYAVTQHSVERVLVLDWDVHHGNGTQKMFYEDPTVLYMSLHRYDQGRFYPSWEGGNYDKVGEGEGQGYNINIAWNGLGYGDPEYMLAFSSVVMPVAQEYDPQLILISAGFDAARGDPLSGYQVSPAMYGHMTRQLASLTTAKIVIVLEGGYNLESISESSVLCAEALLGDDLPHVDITREPDSAASESVNNVIEHHQQFWKCFRK